MNDELACTLSEELMDDTSIGKLKPEHLRNKTNATDSKDSYNITIGETMQPGG